MSLKVFFLGDSSHPNSQNWIYGLEHYGGCEVKTWSLHFSKGKVGRIKRILHWLWAFVFLRRKIKKYNPDILVGYRVTSYGFLGAITGIHPLVIAAQGETDVWPPNHWTTPIKTLLAKFAIKKSSLVHAWGDHMAKSLFDLGVSEKKILIKPRGINLTTFRVENPRKEIDKLRVIVTRGLHPDYRHTVIIKSIRALVDKQIPIELVIAGSGIELENLENLVRELNLQDFIKFTGRVTNEELAQLLRSANVYVSMPITEGVSASLLEAMACGCIPVVSDLPANRKWIKNKTNGFLVPVDDDKQLTEVFERIWEDKSDLIRMIERNSQLVEQEASMERNTLFFIKNYKKLIKEKNVRNSRHFTF